MVARYDFTATRRASNASQGVQVDGWIKMQLVRSFLRRPNEHLVRDYSGSRREGVHFENGGNRASVFGTNTSTDFKIIRCKI